MRVPKIQNNPKVHQRSDSDFILGIRFVGEVDEIQSKAVQLSKKNQKKYISEGSSLPEASSQEANKYNPFHLYKITTLFF